MYRKCKNWKTQNPIYNGYLSIWISGRYSNIIWYLWNCHRIFKYQTGFDLVSQVQYCDTIASIIYNISLTNTAYQCNNKILDDKKYIHPSRQVTIIVILICIFAFLYCFWAIIHDCGLLYKRNGIHNIRYYPLLDDDCSFPERTLEIFKFMVNYEYRIIQCLGWVLLPLILIIFMLSFLMELLKAILVLPFTDPFRVSTFLVGFYRSILVSVIYFYGICAYSFTVSLDYDNKICHCSCLYVLRPRGIDTYLCI